MDNGISCRIQKSIKSQKRTKQDSRYSCCTPDHRIVVWFRMEGTLQITQFQPPAMVIVKHIYTYTQKNPAAKADVLNCETHVNSGTHVSQTCRCAVLLNTSSTTACSSGGAAASINTLPGEAWREAECSFNRGRLALITPIFLPQFTEQFA